MIKDPELLKLAVKAIEEEPERWDQGSWGYGRPKDGEPIKAKVQYGFRDEIANFGIIDLESELCGTTLCLAGHVVTQAGFPLLIDLDGETSEILKEYPYDGVESARCLDTGRAVRVEEKAMELLGIDEDTARRIFSGSAPRNLEEFKDYLTEATGVEFE